MPKRSPTLTYLQQIREDAFRYELAPDDTPPNRMPVGRLCWNTNGMPEVCSDQQFAETIEKSALPEAQFYLDTCFITGREVPQELWAALLRKKIVILPETWSELQPWLKNPFVNQDFRDLLLEAFQVGNPGIRFEDNPNPDQQLQYATRFYVELLAFRKRAYEFVELKLNRELKRPPSEEELSKHVQSLVHDRGHQLAEKGRKDINSPNFYTDEALLVQAVISAITTGRETCILTRDRDLVEQFYKLLYLVDTHYRSHIIGEAYKQQPLNFIESSWPTGNEYFDTHFHSGKLLWLPNANERLLPEQNQFVMVHVYRFSPDKRSDSLQSLGFCAEREMASMLRVKGATRGKNTDAFGISNIHRCISPYHQDALGSFVAIAVDHGVEVSGVTIPFVDIEIAMSRKERIRRIDVRPPSEEVADEDTTDEAYVRSQFLCDRRLAWSWIDDPIETTEKTIARTIGFLPFHTHIHADPSFLKSPLQKSIRHKIDQIGYGTTDAIYRHTVHLVDSHPESLAAGFKRRKPPRGLHIESDKIFAEPYRSAYCQYLSLLAFRKQFGAIVHNRIAEARGVDPTEEEWLRELRSIRGKHEPHALDALAHINDPDYYMEDQLVAHSVLQSILSGTDCVILTRRRIVQQQFISLVMQLEIHYRAYCLAFEALSTSDPIENPPIRDQQFEKLGFLGPPRSCHVSKDFANQKLPANQLDVQLQCWLLEGGGDNLRFEPVAFLAERPMHAMLRTRGKTGGLTTDILGSEDIQFFWMLEGEKTTGRLMFGESSWTELGSPSFPDDPRIDLGLNRIPTKDLIAMANYCSFPLSRQGC